MTRFASILFAVVALAAWSAGSAQAPAPRAKVAPGDAGQPRIQVGVGKQRVLELDQRLQRVAVGEPKVAGVSVLNSRELLITGKKRGETTLLVWVRGSDEPIRYSLFVGPEDLPALLQDEQREHLRTQVQTHVLIAEISRHALRQFGANFVQTDAGANILRVSPPGASGGGSLGGGSLLSNTVFQPIGDAFNLVFADEDRDVFGFLSILERQGLMHTLAEATLVSLSGQTATFIAGGEFPIPVPQGDGGGITIEFKQFGVKLAVSATVLSEERIILKLAPEVSELDFTSGVTVNGVRVPGVQIRRTETTVRLGDGETLVISGLVSQQFAANVDKIPWLGEIPIIGALFRSTSYQRQARELIMVVTPHLVTPLAQGTEIPIPGEQYKNYNPDAAELFFFEDGDFDVGDTGFTR